MRTRLLLLLFILGTFLAVAHGEDRVILTSPRGTFAIVEGEEPDREWVVSAKDPKQRSALGTAHDAQPHIYAVSPDEQWIFACVHIGSGMGAAKLFRRGKGLQFLPYHGGEGWLDEMVWRFYWRSTGAKPLGSGAASPGDEGIIDFVAWSPDSSRVLLDVRAGERGHKGIYRWHSYFNTRTEKLELTDYLRGLNRDAARRWQDDAFRAKWAPPASAEPIDPLPAAAELERRWKAADERLNVVYGQARQAVKAERKIALRNEQRDWIMNRDAGAAQYAAVGAPESASQRRFQFLGDATEARTLELAAEAE